MTTLKLGTGHWDHVLPLALGDVPGAEAYEFFRLDVTPDLWQERSIDAGETSFSKYVRARAEGDMSLTALPVLLMTGFRHRCIITTKEASFESAIDLKGARIGLTGWADSGNTWTRAVLREVGVGIDAAERRVGALTADHPVTDRIGDVQVPGNVAPTENDELMVEKLERGALDAVVTPFMPPGFYEADSKFRTLDRDTRRAETDYYARVGYIPGIHVLAVQTVLLEDRPELAQQLVNDFQAAKLLSFSRRSKLQDITPWQNEAIGETVRTFGTDWMPYGWTPNRAMISGFIDELRAQDLLPADITETELFRSQSKQPPKDSP
jgi:4,5-dihydroxyphthalate decarboxylase